MPEIASVSDIAAKWARVTPLRSEDYAKGVKNPRKDWAKNTEAAEAAYKDGITKSIARGSFVKGVKEAGTKKWQDRAIEVGETRFSSGVAVAQPQYEKGFSKYQDVISKTTLPPRFAKGDARNLQRVTVMANALHKAKTG